LQQADHLILMLPYSAATHHAIGAPELAQMKPSATLVNLARGGIVDDPALIQALAAGRLAGAGLDVFENEPAFDPGFLNLKNVVLTPHIASASAQTRRKMAQRAANNLIAAINGTPPDLVNPTCLTRQRK
jgi:glyoxylate reductase